MALIAIDVLTGLVRDAFLNQGVSPGNAAIMAETVVFAERDGAAGHGLFRLPGYVSTLKSGWVDGTAEPQLELAQRASVVRVDARNGFAQPALRKSAEAAMSVAVETGVAIISIRGSHHFGALWLDVEPFARAGLVALAFVNSVARVVPFGGRKPVFGTNPMAFAAPRGLGDPLVFDQSSSAMAFGDVKLAAIGGRPLPEGAAVDAAGRPTTDAAAALAGGALLPFGNHKGSSIALMIELLAAGLTGGRFSFEVDFLQYPGAQTPCTGELVLLIDPQKTGGVDFASRAETLIARVHDGGQERMPGDRRYANRRAALQRGIPVEQAVLRSVEMIAGRKLRMTS
jgi:delta1-piperideine-2-carboxylate reductase